MCKELKRCPFCGGKARLTYNTYGSHYVQCDSVSCGIVTWIHTTEEEAVYQRIAELSAVQPDKDVIDDCLYISTRTSAYIQQQ